MAARTALSTLRDVQDETEGVESGTTGRTTRVRRALATDRLYLSAVVNVLSTRRSPLLDQLGPHTLGKSCVYVKNLEALDLDVLERLTREAWETPPLTS